MTIVYPWHQEQWQYFANMMQSHSLPHAIMLSGPAGIGKHAFAKSLAASFICNHKLEDGSACGECKH